MNESKTIKELKDQIRRLQQDVEQLSTSLRIPQDETDRFYFWVGRAFQKLRAERGITQEQMAADLGITRTSLANMEGGKQRAPLHVWKRAAERLKMSFSDVLDYAEAIESDYFELHKEEQN